MYFNLFGIICGGVLSYYLIAIRSRRLLLVTSTIYHIVFGNRITSYMMRPKLSSPTKWWATVQAKTMQAFCARYRKLQPHATSRLNSLWNALAWQVGRDYGIVFIASLALFWSNYLAFIAPFLIVQVAWFVYLYFYKRYRLDFYAILMVSLLLKS